MQCHRRERGVSLGNAMLPAIPSTCWDNLPFIVESTYHKFLIQVDVVVFAVVRRNLRLILKSDLKREITFSLNLLELISKILETELIYFWNAECRDVAAG